eukprot:c3427_g1_i1.p1 GENE.c3427_g1_i1~~c3427_g1_i1.p1  ORF type:complete len:111 (-),score=5.22 c3427_g1_i1:165-497(-)
MDTVGGFKVACLRGIEFAVVPGSDEQILLGKPEWKSLGLILPQEQLDRSADGQVSAAPDPICPLRMTWTTNRMLDMHFLQGLPPQTTPQLSSCGAIGHMFYRFLLGSLDV